MEYLKERDNENDDAVDALLGLSVKNLESRISFLEAEIQRREAICREADSRLGAEILQSRIGLDRVRYADIAGPISSERRKVAERVDKLEELHQRHVEAAFRDTSSLRIQLQEAIGELEKAIARRSLMAEESDGGGRPIRKDEGA